MGFALLLLSSIEGWSADLTKGMDAAQRGDYATALREWKPLAEQGNTRARFYLGVMYDKGRGVPQDYKTAVKWFRLAAEQGDADAQTNLERLEKQIAERTSSPTVTAEKTPTPPSDAVQKELERLRRENERLKQQQKKSEPEVAKKNEQPPPSTGTGTSGSGFFVSKLGHVLTNEHVVRTCKEVTVGDNVNRQVQVAVVETDRRNDLALLKLSSTSMASAETKSLISKLGIRIVSKSGESTIPLSSNGLLRSYDVELGENCSPSGFVRQIEGIF